MQIPVSISPASALIEFRRLYDMAYNYWWSGPPRPPPLRRDRLRAWAIYRNPLQMLINLDPSFWSELHEDSTFVQLTRAWPRVRAYSTPPPTPGSGGAPGHAGGPFALRDGVRPSIRASPLLRRARCSAAITSRARATSVPSSASACSTSTATSSRTSTPTAASSTSTPPTTSAGSVRPAGHTGREVLVTVPFPGREVTAKVWIAQVGRVPLLLLDTDVPQNDPADRPIGSILYTPGREMRLAQELLLGVGGVRALHALGIEPSVWHLNEGHSVLLVLERLRELLSRGGAPLAEAVDRVRRRTVFTTHTPVPAGNEQFEPHVARKYLEPWSGLLGLPVEELLALGNADHGEPEQNFNLTAMSVRASSFVNGVSRINAEVANGMWWHLFAEKATLAPKFEAVTNGVHPPTWLGTEMQRLFTGRLGADWNAQINAPRSSRRRSRRSPTRSFGRPTRRRRPGSPASPLPAADAAGPLRCRPRGAAGARRLLRRRLTIGFARRFATYKRAALLFSDLHRLRPGQPSRTAGADPPRRQGASADRAGQELIQHLPAELLAGAQGAGLLSSRITTCGSGGCSSAASTSGSTPRVRRRRRAARAA